MVDFSDNTPHPVFPLLRSERPFVLEVDQRPDKSLTHRVLIFAAVAAGRSRIFNPLLGEDCLTTAKLIQALGCQVILPHNASEPLIVDSPGIDRWQRHPGAIDFGNSGTTARLMIGLLASLKDMTLEATGDASLITRPMKRVVEPLKDLGADIEYLGQSGYLPIRIKGRDLRPGKIVSDKASAQVKSALMLAALNVDGEIEISLPAGGRDHTERLLTRLGARIRTSQNSDHLETICMHGRFRPSHMDSIVPNDPSSAAFVFALPLIHGSGEVCCRAMLLNPGRIHFLHLLARMGAEVNITNRRQVDPGGLSYVEEVGDVTVRPGKSLIGITIAADEVPMVVDEIPILSVVATFATGKSRFLGLEELRVKESDRLLQTGELLELSGAGNRIDGNNLEIAGSLNRARQFQFNPKGDHRLAMAAAIMMTRSGEVGSAVIGSRCVDVSFPGFFALLEKINGNQ